MQTFPVRAAHHCLAVFLGVACLLSICGCVPVIVRTLPRTQGVVLDADTDQPVRGAIVTARYWNTGLSGTARATCDDDGRFSLGPRYALKMMVLGPNDANMADRCQYTAEAPGFVGTEYSSGLVLAPQPKPLVSFDPTVGTIFRLKRAPPPSSSETESRQ